jgi:hypothetical protein
MNNTDFEGHIGTGLNDTSFADDVLLIIILLLLTGFAILFRLNMHFFRQIISSMNTYEHRGSLFEKTEKDRFFFNMYLVFQSLFLCSIFIMLAGCDYLHIPLSGINNLFPAITIIFLVLLVFYLFKKSIYDIFARIFSEPKARKLLAINCQAIFSIWGILLFIPVLWILLVKDHFFLAYIAFIINYIAFRAAISYRFIHIFLNKNTEFLFLSLYLCAQEIVPLVLLYKVLINLDSIIEVNNIWN